MADDIPGIYVALQSGLAIGVAGLVNRTEWVVHILFPGGAYRHDWPAQGLVGDFGHDQAKEASSWGRWQADGATVTIERPDAALAFTAEPGAIIDESGNRYARLSEEDVDLRSEERRVGK